MADDLQPITEEYTYLLEKTGKLKVVGVATTGKEMVELGLKTKYDLALIDIEMADATDGIRAARELVQKKPEGKVAFLTSHNSKETILAAMATGAVDYVVKGIPDEQFIQHIFQIINGNPTLDQSVQQLLLSEYQRLRNTENVLLNTVSIIKQLTNAETELIGYLLEGKTQKQIAQIRHVELVTVKAQTSSIIRKFGVTKTKQIVKLIKDLEIESLFL